MILLIDNYDSFTYNLYQYFSELNADIKVIRNDQITIDQIEKLDLEAIIISPGPGVPNETGICIDTVKHFYKSTPILGVCLGQQVIAEALGGKVVRAKQIMHGKTSLVTHSQTTVFKELPDPIEVMRYHSLVVDAASLPDHLEIVAQSIEDGEIMALKHKYYPLYGVQFHPESIGTLTGKQIIQNFIHEIRKEFFTNETVS